MPQRIALGTVGLTLALAVPSCGDRRQATSRTSVGPRAHAPFHCPATIPNGQAPPGENRNPSDLGNGGLWSVVPVDGRLVITIMGAVSQWERETIGERTKDACSTRNRTASAWAILPTVSGALLTATTWSPTRRSKPC